MPRCYGAELRNVVKERLNMMYSYPSRLLSVLLPAILPSRGLMVLLGDTIGGKKVSELVSSAAYANCLERTGPKADLVPIIVPAFLRQASEDVRPGLQSLRPWAGKQ